MNTPGIHIFHFYFTFFHYFHTEIHSGDIGSFREISYTISILLTQHLFQEDLMKEILKFSGAGQTILYSVLWIPETPVKFILQIAHGMTEHIERYDTLATDLNSHGILVAGYDLRGHGHNIRNTSCCSMGEESWKKSLDDMHLFYQLLDTRFPGLPHGLLGFSLGSFLVREYLANYSSPVCGAIIMGTGDQPGFLLSFLKWIIRGQIRSHGFHHTTPLVKKLSFGAYNGKFSPARTPCDWLISDEEQVDLYRNDPLCQQDISSGLFWQLLDSMERTGKPAAFQTLKKDLPILLLSGENDPVGDFGKGVLRVAKKMKAAGCSHISSQLIPDCRHDLLHEFKNGGAQTARDRILSFLLELL